MPKPSRERIVQIARLLVEEMDRSDSVRLLKDREAIRQATVHALTDELKQDEERHNHVVARIASLEEAPSPGTKEWTALFRKYLDEEYERAGFDSA